MRFLGNSAQVAAMVTGTIASIWAVVTYFYRLIVEGDLILLFLAWLALPLWTLVSFVVLFVPVFLVVLLLYGTGLAARWQWRTGRRWLGGWAVVRKGVE